MTADAALVRDAQAGDATAFDALYRRHRDSVYRICRNSLRDEHLAEDATQETFLKAWRSLSTVDADREFSHWLHRVASNHCHDVHRQRRMAVAQAQDLDKTCADPAAEQAVTACVERLALRSTLERLNRRDAALLVHRHISDVPVETLATRWRLTKSSMEMALHRARARARRYAKAEGLGGLVPVALGRRLSGWWQRLIGDATDLAPMAGAAAYQMAIVVAVVVAQTPTLLPGGSDQNPRPQTTVAAADRDEAASPPFAETASDAQQTAAPPSASHRTAEKRVAHASSSKAHKGEGEPPVTFDPFEVPGTGSRVHQSPQSRPHRAVGVRIQAGEDEVHVGWATYEDDDEGVKTATDVACEGADVENPAAYCKRFSKR